MTETMDFPAILAQLRKSYEDALSNGDSELSSWYMLIDQHAETLFQRVEELQNGMDKAAQVIAASDKEQRSLNEKLSAEVYRNNTLRAHHEARIKELSKEPETLRAEIADLKAQLIESAAVLKATESARSEEHLRAREVVKELQIILARLFHHRLPHGPAIEHEIPPDLHVAVTRHLPASDPAQQVPAYARDLLAQMLSKHRKH